jgi:hypothetical protein
MKSQKNLLILQQRKKVTYLKVEFFLFESVNMFVKGGCIGERRVGVGRYDLDNVFDILNLWRQTKDAEFQPLHVKKSFQEMRADAL